MHRVACFALQGAAATGKDAPDTGSDVPEKRTKTPFFASALWELPYLIASVMQEE
ncbi:hypothetical protein HHA02_08400 [Cobetia marina]|nr:hypothetical protein HHA02_08400 [Cobetia marina]